MSVKKPILIKTHVIYTYESIGQDECWFDLPNNLNEEEFLRTILQDHTAKETKDLIKISSCQYDVSKKDSIQWLLDSDGKLYFNPHVNDDVQTMRFYNMKKKIEKEKQKSEN